MAATKTRSDSTLRASASDEGSTQATELLAKHLSEHANHQAEKPDSADAQHGLSITRVFDAPREQVWRAWTDPEVIAKWMGPKQFPAVHVTLGKVPGDQWRVCLRGCQPGTDIPVDLWQGGVLHQIVPPELLVYTYAWDRRADVGLADDGDPHETVVTVRFHEDDGKTTMHFHQAFFITASERDGHNGGWSSSFDRLQDLMHTI